jgi:rare lipoprotein A
MLKAQSWLVAALMGAALALAGCSSDKPRSSSKLDPFAGTGSPYYKGSGKIPKGGGRYHVGRPYQVAGRWFTPREQPGYDKSGVASWYGDAFHRRMTSNGEYFDMNMLSAAHATLPLPSYAKVTNLANGRSVVVRINDRGPFVDTRIIDMSKRAADVLGFRQRGKAEVRVQYIGLAPLNDKGPHLAMMNEQLRSGAGLKMLVAAAGKSAKAGRAVATASSTTPMPDLELAAGTRREVSARAEAYVVEVATFTSVENALAAQEALSNEGPGQVVQTADKDYVLQLGPFRSERMARQALTGALANGFPAALLLPVSLEMASATP